MPGPAANTNTPSVREPETEGLPNEKRDPKSPASPETPVHANTSGARLRAASTMPDPFAERRSDAPKPEGKTPRPTDKPAE